MLVSDGLLHMKYLYKVSFIIKEIVFYLKEKWLKDIYENYKNRYLEKEQLNINLAVIGIEKNILYFISYDARLLGCGLL